MIGRTKAQARPTIVFSCENKIQRQRAMKAVRESAVLDVHHGVCLGESSRPPRLSSEPQQLGDVNVLNESSDGDETLAQPFQSDYHTKDIEMTCNTDNCSPINSKVYYTSPLGGLYGIPIIIKNTPEKAPTRESTVGGFIYVGEQLYGLTVAHAFQGSLQDYQESKDDAIEFSFEEDNQDDGEEPLEDDDFVNMTSRG
jgi:hypothetical protein